MARLTSKDFERVAGAARNYRNKKTGEIISRRKFDQLYGRLSGTGLTNETQAIKNKKSNPVLAAMRPRKGHHTISNPKVTRGIKKNLKKLKSDNTIAHGAIKVGFNLFEIQTVFYTLLRLYKKPIYYIAVNAIDNGTGNKVAWAFNKYEYVPTKMEKIIHISEMLEAQEKKYGVRIESITIHYRVKF